MSIKSDSTLSTATSKLNSVQLDIYYEHKITAFSTFYKYVALYHPDTALQKLKEDECDTCMKYNVFLEDPANSEEDKNKIKKALQV